MKTEELISRIKTHESQCKMRPTSAFHVVEVVELADGVVAVKDTTDEFTLYFDKSKCKVKDGAFKDIGSQILNFPTDTGFITDVMSKSWGDITTTAKRNLRTLKSDEIKWHDKPRKIVY